MSRLIDAQYCRGILYREKEMEKEGLGAILDSTEGRDDGASCSMIIQYLLFHSP